MNSSKFDCDFCGKLFTTNFALKRHRKSQHLFNFKINDEGVAAGLKDTTNFAEMNNNNINDDEWRNDYWRFLIAEAYKNMERIPDDFNEMFSEPYFSAFVKLLYRQIDRFDKLSHDRDRSVIYRLLKRTYDDVDDRNGKL